MGYHPRIETSDMANLITSRCRNSELWFVNNTPLTESILGYAAKYADRYEAKLYAMAIEGNHIHMVAEFPKCNRANFTRDFYSSVARIVPRHVKEYPGGSLFARRYSSEFLPGSEDIEEYFFYTVLQSVQDGFVDDIRKLNEYNCFWDAIDGTRRIFEVIDWTRYNADRRWKDVKLKDYKYQVVLRYERLPGYEDLEQKEYRKIMIKKLDRRQVEIKEQREAQGKTSVAGIEYLERVPAGSRPYKTKKSHRYSHRPRILSICHQRRANCKAWYFNIVFDYRVASSEYREGNHLVEFPPGTYPPVLPCQR